MPINLDKPIEVPAKFYDQMFMAQLVVMAESPGVEASVNMLLKPMDSKTGEVTDVGERRIFINDPFARIAAGDTALAEIMGRIFAYAQEELKK